jgi:hypothetical protein
VWDDLMPQQRREILERELSSALADLRKGRATAANVTRAEATLTVLRAELMTDEVGAARYARLEKQVEEFSSSRTHAETAPATGEDHP